jgi:hypothetical protein
VGIGASAYVEARVVVVGVEDSLECILHGLENEEEANQMNE